MESRLARGLCPTPFGALEVSATNEGLVGIHFSSLTAPEGPSEIGLIHGAASLAHSYVQQAVREIAEYSRGERDLFTVPLAAAGTDYQLCVWRELQRIPYGTTVSYSELAKRVGSAPRAVGRACGANPLLLVIPCHRVIAKDGTLGGFAAGVPVKLRMLKLEAEFKSLRRLRQ